MTVQTEFWNWQNSPKNPDPKCCSPLNTTLSKYLCKTYGGQNLGCYNSRNTTTGSSPSTHWSGAANDWRYQSPGMGRQAMLDQVMPWLIDNSRELGIQAIHDYAGKRIWRPPACSGRPGSPSPECGWKPASSSDMNPANTWLHLEVLNTRWNDTRSVPEMLGDGEGDDDMAQVPQEEWDTVRDRIMGALPGTYSTEQRGPGGSGDGQRRYSLDDQDGNYIVTLLERIASKLGA